MANRLSMNDVADALVNKNVVVYTNGHTPIEGKLVLSTNKLIQITVTPNNASPYYVYINFDSIVAIASTTLVS